MVCTYIIALFMAHLQQSAMQTCVRQQNVARSLFSLTHSHTTTCSATARKVAIWYRAEVFWTAFPYIGQPRLALCRIALPVNHTVHMKMGSILSMQEMDCAYTIQEWSTCPTGLPAGVPTSRGPYRHHEVGARRQFAGQADPGHPVSAHSRKSALVQLGAVLSPWTGMAAPITPTVRSTTHQQHAAMPTNNQYPVTRCAMPQTLPPDSPPASLAMKDAAIDYDRPRSTVAGSLECRIPLATKAEGHRRICWSQTACPSPLFQIRGPPVGPPIPHRSASRVAISSPGGLLLDSEGCTRASLTFSLSFHGASPPGTSCRRDKLPTDRPRGWTWGQASSRSRQCWSRGGLAGWLPIGGGWQGPSAARGPTIGGRSRSLGFQIAA